MRIKHYYCFENKQIGKKLDQNAWDQLRIDTKDTGFGIESSVEQYEKNCLQYDQYRFHARLITCWLKKNNIFKTISFGCGKGVLEWYLKKCGKLNVVCSDYAAEGLKKLEQVFPSCDGFLQYDLMNGDATQLNGFLSAVMYRISTEFSKSEWKKVFDNLAKSNIQYIIFIPTEVAGFRVFLDELSNHVFNILKGKKDVFCGYCYSKNEFPRFWKRHYELVKMYSIGKDNRMYILKKRGCDNASD